MSHIWDPIYKNVSGCTVFIKYLYLTKCATYYTKGTIHYFPVALITPLWDKHSYFHFSNKNMGKQRVLAG